MRDSVWKKIFTKFCWMVTCCYPVWFVSVLPMLFLAAFLHLSQCLSDAVREFWREGVIDFIRDFKNPWRLSLYEANRVSVRPHLQAEWHKRRKVEALKKKFPDME